VETCWRDLRFASERYASPPDSGLLLSSRSALGIGANTAIFSLINAVLLRSLPVREPRRLVVFQWSALRSPNTKGEYRYMSCPPTSIGGEHGCSFSYPMFLQFHSLQDLFSSVTALGGDEGLNLRGHEPAALVHGDKDRGLGPMLLVALREFDDVLGEGLEEAHFEEAGRPSVTPSGLT